MITLYGFGRAFGLPDLSPFVAKAEVLLRMSGLPYQYRRGDSRKSPKGKLPYIDDDGLLVPDSTFIRWHLEERHGIDFTGGYSPAELATGLAFERMLEDHAYWAAVDARWNVDRNFNAGPARYFRTIPAPLRPLITAMVRRSIRKALHSQGFGRHSRTEIERLGIADVDAVATFLGDKAFLLGDRPCGADATVFAFVQSALCPIFDSPIRTAAQAHPNLVNYVERCTQLYFPEGIPAA